MRTPAPSVLRADIAPPVECAQIVVGPGALGRHVDACFVASAELLQGEHLSVTGPDGKYALREAREFAREEHAPDGRARVFRWLLVFEECSSMTAADAAPDGSKA
jgi:hypothetical protein